MTNNPELAIATTRFDVARAKAIITEWTDIEGPMVLEGILAALTETILEDPRIQQLRDLCDDEDEGSWAAGLGHGGSPATVDIRQILNNEHPYYPKTEQQ